MEVKKRIDYLSWDEYFMGIAKLSALRSKDPSTQVGACIVSDDNRILSIGYNGAPNGFNDDSFPWDREGNALDTKYLYVCHAELNAILNFRGNKRDLEGSKIYVALFPCNECAKAIIQSGIKEVIYLSDKYHDQDNMIASRRLFDECGVRYHEFKAIETKKIEIELDNFNVRSNATVIGNQDKEIDVEQIKKILDKRYNSAPRRRSIRIEPQEEVSKISVDDTKEYDLTKVLEKAKDEKVETYEENRAKKLRNTQYDILNNLNLDASDEEVKEEKKIDPEENLMNLINTITINEAKKQESKKDDVDPLDILTDLKGEDDTQVYDSVTTVTKITEIKEKEKEKIDNNKDNNIDNSFYTDNLFKKKDFEEDSNDFVDEDKLSIGIKILIALVIIVFVVGLILFIKSVI